jgi:hypothetical protein
VRTDALFGALNFHRHFGFEVMYPVDWYQHQFAPRTIVFKQVLNYTVAAGPFAGKPTILDVSELGEREGRVSVRIDTNAGVRTA